MPIVHIKDFEFTPPALHVRKGARVRWEWEDENVSHTVTSRGKERFKSAGARREGGTYEVTFPERGTYRYGCMIHPFMKGRVVVGKPTQH